MMLKACGFCDAKAAVPYINPNPDNPALPYYIECVEEKGGCGLTSKDFATLDQAQRWWNTGKLPEPE